MNKISVEIVADSISPQGDRLISVLATFPRIILSEMNTHRMLSKNTSSSRAIPFKKMVESIKNDPFVPIAWQKQHSGMQGTEYWDVSIIEEIGGFDYTNIPAKWLRARDTAINMAETLHDSPIGITKQLCNRLLEPFMWTTMLITGPRSGWDNFFNLRCPQYKAPSNSIETANLLFKSKKDMIDFYVENDFKIGAGALKMWTPLDWMKVNQGQAEIHIMDLAEKIYDALNESTPRQLKAGEWHIPFGDKIHKVDTSMFSNPTSVEPAFDLIRVKISTAMAARTSYTVVGDEKEIDSKKMIELHDRLLTQDPPHSSPMEHCAQAMSDEQYYLFNRGEASIDTWSKSPDELSFTNAERGWCRNFKGFIPYRHIIENK